MGLTYTGQRDDGTTRRQGPIGVEEHKPPVEDEEKPLQRGPAGITPLAAVPGQDVDLREEETHVQSTLDKDEPAPKPPPPEQGPKVAQKKKRSWIEFHVVRKTPDGNEENVPGVTLHVKLPDDTEEDPKTGGNGKKKFEPIDPGTCDLKEVKYRHLLEVVSISSS